MENIQKYGMGMYGRAPIVDKIFAIFSYNRPISLASGINSGKKSDV